MTVNATVADNGATITIRVSGRFDFSTHQDFKKAYEQLPGNGGKFVIDLGDTEYLDSSALGMLLILRDYAGGDSANLLITNCREEVKNVLTIANFQQLMKIQ